MSQFSEDKQALISVKTIIESFKYWPRVFRIFWDVKKSYFVIILLLHILLGIAPVVSIYVTQELINSIIIGWDVGFQLVLWFFILFIIVTLVKEMMGLLQGYFEGLFLTLFNNHINVLVMNKANDLSLADFENAEIQNQIKRVQQESGYRPYQIFQKMLALVTAVFSLVSAAGFIASWHAGIALLLLCVPLLSFYSFLKLAQKEFIVHWRRAPRTREQWYLSYLLTHDHSFKEVKIYQIGTFLIQKYRQIFKGFYGEDVRLARLRLVISLVFMIISMIVLFGIIFYIVRATYLQVIMVGNLVAYIQAIMLIHGSSQSIIMRLIEIGQNNLYLKQLFSFLDASSMDTENKSIAQSEHSLHEIADNVVPIHKQNKNEGLNSHVSAVFDSTINKDSERNKIEHIEFKNVSFQYPGTDKYVLKNINLELKKGETVAIVGRNGSGKTTLVKLLVQLYNHFEGDILINGQSIRSFDKERLRQKIGVVFQDFTRYELPVRSNIGFGNVDFTSDDEKIYQAAKQAGIIDLIQEMPQQLDTRLGRWFENGYQLSGGQWQRIGIARSYIRNADLYVLDEPSSALDPESEIDVFNKFNTLIKNKLGLFISHRYTSVKYAQKIIVLDEGQIAEQGTHEQLMKKNGVYRDLYSLQVSSYLA